MDVEEKLTRILVNFIKIVETRLSTDVVRALERAAEVEEGLAREVALAMIKNTEVAKDSSIPICEDTGIPEFFVELGLRNPYAAQVGKAIVRAVEKATEEVSLRPNAVNPFTNINTGNNIGRYVPWIHYDVLGDSDVIKVRLYVAGGGSSFAGEARGLTPIGWENQLIDFVVEKALKYGVNACPPLLVGIGIGPTIEIASTLSKKALLREIGRRHEEPYVAEMEIRIQEKLNSYGLGPQGLRGKTFVLDVFIEYAHRHPANVIAAVSFGCWVHRKGCLVIYPDLSYEIPTHGVGRRYD